MTNQTNGRSLDFCGRVAGFMYLFTIASYFAGTWLAAHHAERLGYLLMLLTSWATVLLAGSLYVVLRGVDPLLALFALLWRTGEAVLGALSIALRITIFNAGGAADLARNLNGTIFSLTTLFFTAGSTLFLWLFLKSRLIPRAIAGSGLIASLLFAMLACANLLAAKLTGLAAYAWAPMLPAELITGAWLLFFGVTVPIDALPSDPLDARDWLGIA